MAKIIEFRSADWRCGERALTQRDCGSAEVIIFPGVRYERWGESGAALAESTARKRPRRQRRDTLELGE